MTFRTVNRAGIALTELSLGCAQLGNLYRAITTSRPARRSTPHGSKASATSTPRRTTGSGSPNVASGGPRGAPPQRVRPVDEGRTATRAAESGTTGCDDEGFDVPATHRRVWDFSRDGVLRSLEESLERLGLERVDIVYLHDPDEHDARLSTPPTRRSRSCAAQGVVSAIGAGMNQTAMLADFARHTDMDVLMLAGRYTLLDQSALDDLLPVCEATRHRDRRRRRVQQRAARTPRTRRRRQVRLRRCPGGACPARPAHGGDLRASWHLAPRGRPGVSSGASRPSRACASARARRSRSSATWPCTRPALPVELWDELRAEGLLRADAPTGSWGTVKA